MNNKEEKVILNNGQNPLVSVGIPVFNGLQKKKQI